ncbi:MAG: putative DNA binding domain-containing protein [Desulfobacteraceae bacterium]|nr:putative DNA binding domain-containing protein [Desulfobacteraceae bacterium]
MEYQKMNAIELLDIINTGETSKVQFKEKMSHPDSIAGEMIAMSNSMGGMILFGVKDKTGEIIGLSYEEIHRYSQNIGNYATNNIVPGIYIKTEIVSVDSNGEKKILIVYIDEGINKPYKDLNRDVWVKQSSDKRRVTDNAEMLRIFQQGSHLLADEMEVYDTSIEDINQELFRDYFSKEFQATIEEKGLSFEQALKVKKVLRNDKLTLAGVLFFGKEPQTIKPGFCIKVVSFFGNSLGGNDYRSKPEDLIGTIPELFKKGMNFLESNLRYMQKGQNFNFIGILEISKNALVEILVNALIHRDYLKNAPTRIMIFDNSVEIISPGKLPNSLTVEEAMFGNPVIRNPQLVKFSFHTMPFSGIGTGLIRALKEQPDIEFINDVDGEQFIVKIPRPEEKR